MHISLRFDLTEKTFLPERTSPNFPTMQQVIHHFWSRIIPRKLLQDIQLVLFYNEDLKLGKKDQSVFLRMSNEGVPKVSGGAIAFERNRQQEFADAKMRSFCERYAAIVRATGISSLSKPLMKLTVEEKSRSFIVEGKKHLIVCFSKGVRLSLLHFSFL